MRRLPAYDHGAFVSAEGRCTFTVWAPRRSTVDLALADVRVAMEPREHGWFVAERLDVAEGARYAFVLDGELERPDPASRLQPDGVHGRSQIVGREFDWKNHNPRRDLEDYVIYELHLGTFTARGTFDAAIDRLGDVAGLGVTAVELMPVAAFPGTRNWGYDGVYPFAVQQSYGGPAGLKRFVDAAHGHGLSVVLDVVYNHLGPEGNYLRDFGPYFTADYHTPWGEALNFDGPDSTYVRAFFGQSARRWVDEFRIDALRFDAIHAIVDRTARPFLEELTTGLHSFGEERRRDVHIFAETNQNDPRVVASEKSGGLGFDAMWVEDLHHAIHAKLTGERDGYYADYGETKAIERTLASGFHLQGQHSEFYGRRHGRRPEGLEQHRVVGCLQNHDQAGNRARGERITAIAGARAHRLGAMVVLLAPQIPLLFMGEEYAESAPFPYFVDHGDEDLLESVRAGRLREFARFDWSNEPLDPGEPATFEMAKLDWSSRRQPAHARMLAFYRAVLARRVSGGTCAVSRHRDVIVIHREEQLLLANFGDARPVGLPADRDWEVLLDSGDPTFADPPHRVERAGNKLQMPELTAALLRPY